MYLDTASKTLEIILSAAKTTNDCEFTADYIDTQSGTTFAPANVIGLSNGTGAVTAVGSPAASTQRKISAFTFYNADTVNTAVTVRIYDGTNRRRIIVVTLTPGQSLVFTPEAGWSILQSTLGQIPGTQTNDNAAAGNIGEFIESVVTDASGGVPASNGISANLTSIALTPGDWDVCASMVTNPAGTTVTTTVEFGVSLVSNTLPAVERRYQNDTASTAGHRFGGDVANQRFSLSANTTLYAVFNVSFNTSTLAVDGFINARRRR